MAVRLGYQLSSEEHRPNDLVRYAQMAEEHGFTFAAISDHFHPWIDAQGQSPFVWSVIGAIAHATAAKYVKAGFDRVLVHQVGSDHAGFFAFFAREVLPRLRGAVPRPAAGTRRRAA